MLNTLENRFSGYIGPLWAIYKATLCFANHGQFYFQVGIITVMIRFEVGLAAICNNYPMLIGYHNSIFDSPI